MWRIRSGVKLWVASESVDFRKMIDGLLAETVSEFCSKPQSGDLFVFHNRSRNKVKVLLWDNKGFVVIYKRLEKGRFLFPRNEKLDPYEISERQLEFLFAGLDFLIADKFKELSFEEFY